MRLCDAQTVSDGALSANLAVVENENDVLASGDLKRVSLEGMGRDGDCIWWDVND